MKLSTRARERTVTLVAVALGGMLGAYARFRLSTWIHERAGHGFPWGTLAVNVAGSFLLGLVLPQVAGEATPPRAFATVGFLGAFTTFSAFAAETVALARERPRRAAAYVAASLALGLGALVAGLTAGRALG